MKILPPKRTTPAFQIQTIMNLEAVTEKEVDGIGMGVLSDGTPYLTARGLARLCGIEHSQIVRLSNDWGAEQFRRRGKKIADILASQKYAERSLFFPVQVNGSTHYAFPEVVCMAVLEYYALEAGENSKEQALANFRLLARLSFRSFIYTRVRYDPREANANSWRQFHDRVTLVDNKVPDGYFCVFKEMAGMIVPLIEIGVPVDEKTVPDISVGQTWATYWKLNNLELRFGTRVTFEHFYPDYFPQAASNPQPCNAYPDAALAAFRHWLKTEYLPSKFPEYLKRQTKSRALPAGVAKQALAAFCKRKSLAAGQP